jgi:hypothetical protein
MPDDPTRTLAITQQLGSVSVGRSHEDQPLSLVVPQAEVRALANLVNLARARVLGSPDGAGSDAILALTARLSDIIDKYEAAVSIDSLTARESRTMKEALSELERLAKEIEKL